MTAATVILPISYFPPIRYFACLANCPEVMIETGETYPKQTTRNRCIIATSHGTQKLVVPVAKPFGNRTRTYEVVLSTHEDWRKKHWRALETAYSGSPYYIYYSDMVKDLVMSSYASLAEMDLAIINTLMRTLKLQTIIHYSEGYHKENEHIVDLRHAFSEDNGSIILPTYHQPFQDRTGFLAGLSVLDLLFNLGPESHSYLKRCVLFSR